MALPAAGWALQYWLARISGVRRRAAAAVAIAVLAAIPTLLPPLTPFAFADRRHPIDEGRQWGRIAEQIRSSHRSGKRVMFEGYNVFHTDRDPMPPNNTVYGHMMLPTLSGATFLGGHYPNFFNRYNEANFSAGSLGSRPIESLTRKELLSYLEAYNVDLIIVHTRFARQALADNLPEAEEIWQVGAHRAFRYEPPGNYFYRGSGRIEFAYGQIRLSELIPDADGRVVVKCHYIDGMQADDGSSVTLITVPGAVLPLIAIEPQSNALTLSL